MDEPCDSTAAETDDDLLQRTRDGDRRAFSKTVATARAGRRGLCAQSGLRPARPRGRRLRFVREDPASASRGKGSAAQFPPLPAHDRAQHLDDGRPPDAADRADRGRGAARVDRRRRRDGGLRHDLRGLQFAARALAARPLAQRGRAASASAHRRRARHASELRRRSHLSRPRRAPQGVDTGAPPLGARRHRSCQGDRAARRVCARRPPCALGAVRRSAPKRMPRACDRARTPCRTSTG